MKLPDLIIRTALAVAVVFASLPTHAQEQPRIDPHNVNGRLESLSSSLNAVVNECATQRGQLTAAAAAEITKLQERVKELESKLPKPESKEKP